MVEVFHEAVVQQSARFVLKGVDIVRPPNKEPLVVERMIGFRDCEADYPARARMRTVRIAKAIVGLRSRWTGPEGMGRLSMLCVLF
jgi:hypothetical protein